MRINFSPFPLRQISLVESGFGSRHREPLTDSVRFSGNYKPLPPKHLPPFLDKPDPSVLEEIRGLSRTDFLDKKQELALGRAIQWGLYAQNTKNTRKIRDESDRSNLIEQGQWAEGQLALRYQLMLYKMVNKMALQFAHPLLPNLKDDLLSSGNCRLIHAIRKYDPVLNFKFSTLCDKSLSREIYREAITQRQQVELTYSLDYRISEKSLSLLDRLPDPRPSQSVEQHDLAELLNQAMHAVLDERERTIVHMVTNGETLEATGQVLKITKERVRQLLKKCYTKLQGAAALQHLSPAASASPTKSAVSPEVANSLKDKAFEFYARQTQIQPLKGTEPDFIYILEEHNRREHGGLQPVLDRIAAQAPSEEMATAMAQFKTWSLKPQTIAALLTFGFEPQAIIETLALLPADVNKIHRQLTGKATKNSNQARNIKATEETLVNLPRLPEMMRQAVAMRHGIGVDKAMPMADIAEALLGGKQSAETQQMMWLYACGAMRLKHLKSPVATPEVFNRVIAAVRKLPETQRRIFEMYYGLKDAQPKPLTWLAKNIDWGVPRDQRKAWMTRHYEEAMEAMCKRLKVSTDVFASVLMASSGTWTE